MKQNRTKFFSLLLAWMLLLSACGQSDDTEKPDDQPLTLTIRTGEKQTTLDPADSTAAGSETILFHLYENLMRWEDDGNGFAKLAPGQAASYEVETDYEECNYNLFFSINYFFRPFNFFNFFFSFFGFSRSYFLKKT